MESPARKTGERVWGGRGMGWGSICGRRAVAGALMAFVGLMPGDLGAVVIDEENRRGLTRQEREHYAATGRLDCGGVVSTAQLTGSASVITTVAHGFYGKGGRQRSPFDRCRFRIGGRDYRIDPSSVTVGSKTPYAVAGTRDWAVARLTRPVPGIVPYQLSAASREVTLVAQGHSNWRRSTMSIETCRARSRGPEIAIDCDTGQGASGAALLVPGTRRIFGIFVGFRSAQPNRSAPFDARSHHNYGVTIHSRMRSAIQSLAR